MNNSERKVRAQNTIEAVIAAYKSAIARSRREPGAEFEAAVRAYQARHPEIPSATVRSRVASILCFGGGLDTALSFELQATRGNEIAGPALQSG